MEYEKQKRISPNNDAVSASKPIIMQSENTGFIKKFLNWVARGADKSAGKNSCSA